MTEGIQLKTVKMKSGFKIERNCIDKDGYVDISESLQKIALGTQKLRIIEIYTNYKGTHPQPKSFCSYSFDILTLYNLLQTKSTTKSIFWSISDKYKLSLFLPCTGFQSRMKSRLWSQRENADKKLYCEFGLCVQS